MDRQAEGTLPPHTFAILLVYFLQQQTKPVLDCIHEYLDPSSEDVYISPVDVEGLAGWRTQNKMSPAELWIELFAFLSIGFKSVELVVSISKSVMLTNEEKQWKMNRLAVGDPVSCIISAEVSRREVFMTTLLTVSIQDWLLVLWYHPDQSRAHRQ